MTPELSLLKAIESLAGASGFLDGLMMFCAQFLVYGVAFVFLIKLLVHREPYERLSKILLSSVALIISAGIFQTVLGYFIFRAAPAEVLGSTTLLAYGGTFPAFSVTIAFSLAAVSSVVLSKRFGTWMFAFAGIISFAQVFTGMYWPLDVMTSFLMGIVGVLIAKRITPARS